MKADRLSSLFWLALGAASLYGSVGLGVGTLQEPGSGFLACVAGGFISLMALVIFAQSFLRGQGFQARLSSLWAGVNWRRPLIIVLLILGFILALETLGFFVSSFLLIVILMKGVEKLSWKKTLIIPAITLTAAYGLFNIFLKVNLPRGIFGF